MIATHKRNYIHYYLVTFFVLQYPSHCSNVQIQSFKIHHPLVLWPFCLPITSRLATSQYIDVDSFRIEVKRCCDPLLHLFIPAHMCDYMCATFL